MQNQSGPPGVPTAGRRMFSQTLNFLPALAAVPARKQSCRFGSGVQCPVSIAQRPDLRELICERQRLIAPVHHGGELWIVGCPVVDLTFCELCNFPSRTQVFRAPHPGAVPFSTPTGPQQPRGSVTDEMVDGPAIAEWPLDRPALPVAPAGYQESTLRRADEYRDAVLAHYRRFSGCRTARCLRS